jgi:transcription initiation factor TFIIIB Brf1 subunit/transcription initiation factor TFIIB
MVEDDDSVYAPELKLKKKAKMIKSQIIKKQSKYEGKKRGRKPGQTAAAIKA